MKKMLMLASVASMIDQFNLPNIELLQEMGMEKENVCAKMQEKFQLSFQEAEQEVEKYWK